MNPEDKAKGRKKGSVNKQTLLALDRIDHYKHLYGDTFLSPFDFLICTMNGIDHQGHALDVDMRTRVDCAKAAVQFVNPKLSQMDMQVEQTTEELTDEEKKAKLAELMKNPAIQQLLGDQGNEQ